MVESPRTGAKALQFKRLTLQHNEGTPLIQQETATLERPKTALHSSRPMTTRTVLTGGSVDTRTREELIQDVIAILRSDKQPDACYRLSLSLSEVERLTETEFDQLPLENSGLGLLMHAMRLARIPAGYTLGTVRNGLRVTKTTMDYLYRFGETITARRLEFWLTGILTATSN